MVFLKVLKAMKEKEKEIRILILGLDNAGKTTIVKTLNGEPTDEVAPTLGFSIKTLSYKGFQLNVWDVGGQKTIRAFWKNYFENTEGLVWVVDSADTTRLLDCRLELKELLKEERLAGVGLLILANKTDLAGSLPEHKIQEILELTSIKSHHWRIQACSAITGEGLEKGISWLVDEICVRI